MNTQKGQRPTILYVVHSLNPGGTERLAADMAVEFSREFNVVVAALDEPGRWAKEVRYQGIEVHGLYRQEGLDLTIPRKIAALSKRKNVAIIHAHQTTPWFYSALSRYLWPRPRLLFEEHGRFYPEVYKWKKVAFNRLFVVPRTHRVVAVSRDVRQRVAQYEGVPEGSIDVIYNGKRLPKGPRDRGARERLRRELGFSEGDFLVGSVGRFDPIKNFKMFVDAVAGAHSKVPAIKGVIIGDGPTYNEIKHLVASKGLEDVLHLPGFKDHASRLILAFDLFALTSLSEGTSMALLEAMSLGVAPVVTSVGGNPEIVKDRETGWLVGSNDVEALKERILYAVDHPRELLEVGSNAQKEFRMRFTFEKMISGYRDIYYHLL